MKVTYYLDITSSWGFWSEPAWAELKTRFEGKVVFDWQIALMDASGLPVSRSQTEWFYRRSGTIMKSPRMLNAGWFEPGLTEYIAPNAVAVAARDLGSDGDTVRLALARAGLVDGRRIGRWEESVAIGADAANLDAATLEVRARSAEVLDRMRGTTAEYHAYKMSVRPALLIENTIGDRAVLSGLVAAAPIAAVIDAMLQDEAAYASHAAHYGGPPAS